MRLLSVETSSPIFSVAISEGEQILSSRQAKDPSYPSALLTELIREAATAAGLELSQLDGFAISIGPGSFTGLRVGVMTVKTLAWALKKPILPVSSLEVIAQNLADQPQPICIFVDARKGKVYTALFSPQPGGLVKRVSEDQLVPPEEPLKKVTKQTLLVGDGVRRYLDLIRSLAEGKVDLAPPQSWIPTAQNLCRIAAHRWPDTKVDDPHRLVPQYLYSQESDVTGW